MCHSRVYVLREKGRGPGLEEEEAHQLERERRCLENRGHPLVQISFLGKKKSLLTALFLVKQAVEGEVKSFFLNLLGLDCF